MSCNPHHVADPLPAGTMLTRLQPVINQALAGAGMTTDQLQGKRVRVRIGPFATRDEAERALHKLQALGLSGAVLTL